jgi:hypothetical protein
MKVGFDLDGVLDRPVLKALCLALLAAGIETYCITGVFPEALQWQDADAKRRKMDRLGIPYVEMGKKHILEVSTRSKEEEMIGKVRLHILTAVASTFDRDYRLADLGLRKGALCEELGIELFIEDSELYAEMIPKMSGGTTILLVR